MDGPSPYIGKSDLGVEELSQEAFASVQAIEAVAFAPEPPQWWWMTWVAAFFIVSLGASLTTEAIKGWFGLKEKRAWRKAGRSKFAKIGLLFPVLAFFGGTGGALLFTRFPALWREGPLIEDWVIAAAIGTIAPVFAVPLWELAIFLLGLFRFRAGNAAGATTGDIRALEGAAKDTPDSEDDDSDDRPLVARTEFREALDDAVEKAMREHEEGPSGAPGTAFEARLPPGFALVVPAPDDDDDAEAVTLMGGDGADDADQDDDTEP